jgi:hypothetical protein
MATNHLILSTQKEEEAADDLLSALTTLAYATPQVQSTDPEQQQPKKLIKKKKKRVEPRTESRHRSQFFYMPTVSIADEVEAAKPISEPKVLEAVNAEVDSRVSLYSKELPTALQPNIEAVREYFVSHVAPKTLAVQAGTAQALDVIQRTLNTAIDPAPFAQFERMVAQARLIKMAGFVADYMQLPATAVADLVDSVTPKKEVMIFHPNMGDERRPPKPKQTPEKKRAVNEENEF